MKTNCVDTTITNLLENKEELQMEAIGGVSSGSGPPKMNSSAGPAPDLKVWLDVLFMYKNEL